MTKEECTGKVDFDGWTITYYPEVFNDEGSPITIGFTISDSNPDSPVFNRGYIKWDGCSEWPEQSSHFCGVQDLHRHYRALNACYIIAQTFMPEAH